MKDVTEKAIRKAMERIRHELVDIDLHMTLLGKRVTESVREGLLKLEALQRAVASDKEGSPED